MSSAPHSDPANNPSASSTGNEGTSNTGHATPSIDLVPHKPPLHVDTSSVRSSLKQTHPNGQHQPAAKMSSDSRASTAPSSPASANSQSPKPKKVTFSPITPASHRPVLKGSSITPNGGSGSNRVGLGLGKISAVESPHLHTKYVPMSPRDEKLFHTRSVKTFLGSSAGRESLLRFLQYSLRLTVFVQASSMRKDKEGLSRLLALVQTLSAARRVMNLVTIYEVRHSLLPFAFSLDVVVHICQAVLDLIATLADNVYLFYRIKLVPFISRARAERADRIADLATLSSAVLGLINVEHSRRLNWREGVQRRKALWLLEDRLDEAIEDEIRSSSGADKDKCREREKALRDRLRGEKKKLKALRTEMDDLYWDRLKLGAEALFAFYDLRGITFLGEAVRSVSGIVSASIGFVQAWRDHGRG